jgi:CheY-like chemotaxis protein
MARILFVDDELTTVEMAKLILTAKGHQVICAGNGIEALNKIEHEPIDLVITDILMPEMDGYELIRELRKRPNPPKIIAMSGGSRNQEAKGILLIAEMMKADRILLKPFEPASFNDVVMEVLSAVSTT